jgi:predicted ATPase/DNA-binding SARP family transcriptional activator
MAAPAVGIVKRAAGPRTGRAPDPMTATEPLRTDADLPVHLTPFIGRERELDAIGSLMERERLVTLTGAGGSGKTRLAREAAARAAPGFERVIWVDLAPITDGALIPQQVAAALHLPERSGVPPLHVVAETLCDLRTLIILDNCEHVVDACAACVESLLLACGRLRVIATSREALGVAGETAWLVPPLTCDEATQLFIDRARTAVPGFTASPAGHALIAGICHRLDGIPLAIELAAARVRVLSLEQIASRLDDAFRLLTGGTRTAIPRHRTLRATMEWSVALLGDAERALLRRLSVFAGGFGLDAAESVCAGGIIDAEDILDGIAALVDKSWVVMEAGDGIARYHLLETVRQYARELLAEAGERDMYERAHGEHMLAVIEAAAPHLVGGSDQPGLVERLRLEQENIRGAATWMLADPARACMGLRLAGALFWLFYAIGSFRELRLLVDRALALPAGDEPLLRGRALLTSALTALAQGDYPLAQEHFHQALPLLHAGGDTLAVNAATAKLGAAQLLGGRVEPAIVTLDRAVAMTRDAPRHHMGAIFARFWRSWAAYLQGDYELARDLIVGNLDAAEHASLPNAVAHSKAVLARIELARGDVDAACRNASESLEVEHAIGDGWGTALALDAIAMLAAERGRPGDAVRLMGGIEAFRERLAIAIPGVAPAERDVLLGRLRAQLGAAFDDAWGEGRALPERDLVAGALAEAARHTTEHRIPAAAMVPAAPRPRLRVLALGPLEVAVGGRTVDARTWGSVRPRELLVYLLLHPDGRTKEQVGLAFWPDASPAQIRNNFHVTLHRLRRTLGGAAWITLERERYRVDDSLLELFDVRALEDGLRESLAALRRREADAPARVEQALAHFRGDLLDGEPVGDWHLEHRDRLQRRFVEGLMALGAHHTAEARHAKAAEVFRRVLARDDLHEDALRALMRAQAELGERAQALRAYHRYAERLRRELGAAPDRETLRLAEALQASA